MSSQVFSRLQSEKDGLCYYGSMGKSAEYPKWKRLSTNVIQHKRARIVEDEVLLPNGEQTTYVYEPGNGAAAAATLVLHKNNILLCHQYRYPLDRWIYDLPGGGVKKGETLEEGARRECIEEIGMVPLRLVHLATFHANPAKTAWPMHVFFCNTVEEADPKTVIEQEASEVVHKVALPVKELEALIKKGEIVDPSLLIAWYTAKDRNLL